MDQIDVICPNCGKVHHTSRQNAGRKARCANPACGQVFRMQAASETSGQQHVLEERLLGGRRLLASGLVRHVSYGEARLFADRRFGQAEDHRDVLLAVLVDTSSSMKTDHRLERAVLVAAPLAECLKDCPDVESVFLGFNQNVYLCGNHEQHSLGLLQPTGKTNEAGALQYLRETHLEAPRRRKVVAVLSDGLPTVCSVESVCWLVRLLEKELGTRLLSIGFSPEDHPAYRYRVGLPDTIDQAEVRNLGRTLGRLLQ